MTEIPLFVRLKTSSPLSKDEAIGWYRCVKAHVMDGVLSSIQTTNPRGEPDVVFMVHKETRAGEHYYEIPLVRDLTPQEQEDIEDNYEGPQGIIESSSEEVKNVRQGPADAVVMSEEDYNALCETLAKSQHQRWYEERTSAGWSFGLKVDEKNKKHPMIRPWEQLPSQYRKVDYDLPHLFMDLLAQQGYVVVGRNDLNKWLKK